MPRRPTGLPLAQTPQRLPLRRPQRRPRPHPPSRRPPTYRSTPDADLSDLLRSYFRLDDDLDAIYTRISARDDHIAKLIQKYPGVRLMRQPDPWECLVSYICSARAAPPRITHRVETIATQLGRPLTLNGETRHTFPDPATVLAAGPRPDWQQIALGFQRVPHAIIQAAKRISEGNLDLHRLAQPDIPYHEVISQLTDLYCVGPKIANCIALFALNKTEAFPVDSRVRTTVKRLYPSHNPLHRRPNNIVGPRPLRPPRRLRQPVPLHGLSRAAASSPVIGMTHVIPSAARNLGYSRH